MWGIPLVVALIGGVYAYGRYSSTNEKAEDDYVIKNKEVGIAIKLSLAFAASIIIVFTFATIFKLLGFQQDQIWIEAAAIIVFTMILCTYAIILEIRKLNNNDK